MHVQMRRICSEWPGMPVRKGEGFSTCRDHVLESGYRLACQGPSPGHSMTVARNPIMLSWHALNSIVRLSRQSWELPSQRTDNKLIGGLSRKRHAGCPPVG
jgi:hypothetical protein